MTNLEWMAIGAGVVGICLGLFNIWYAKKMYDEVRKENEK